MKPIAIIFNDVHLKTGNEQDIIDSITHLLKYANANGIKDLIFAGDLFDSRSFQRQSVLEAFDQICGLFHKAFCFLHLFPGNHDKTDYNSSYSFLDVYRYHPNIEFCRELKNIVIEDVSITLLPFFADELLIPMLEEAEGGDVLISHFEMNGSTHLGKVSEKSSITRKMLSKWNKVYLGHYHNTHEISKDIIHLPSFRQTNFGEDSNKGFTLLYDDGSYEVIKGYFKEFNKIIIDLDTITPTQLKVLIKTHQNSSQVIRFEFIGEESKLKALDKGQFEGTGIDVKVKFESKYDLSESFIVPTAVKKYDAEQVITTFKSFCSEKGYDGEYGLKYLNEFLNKDKC